MFVFTIISKWQVSSLINWTIFGESSFTFHDMPNRNIDTLLFAIDDQKSLNIVVDCCDHDHI